MGVSRWVAVHSYFEVGEGVISGSVFGVTFSGTGGLLQDQTNPGLWLTCPQVAELDFPPEGLIFSFLFWGEGEGAHPVVLETDSGSYSGIIPGVA